MTITGWLLDKLHAPLIGWMPVSFLTATGLFAISFGSYPSVERALAKSGSFEAYIFPSLNLGITFATAVTLIGTGIYRRYRWQRGTSSN